MISYEDESIEKENKREELKKQFLILTNLGHEAYIFENSILNRLKLKFLILYYIENDKNINSSEDYCSLNFEKLI